MAKNNNNNNSYGTDRKRADNLLNMEAIAFQIRESYKTARTNIVYSIIKKGCKKISFTSANKGEGKTHQYVARVTRAEYTRQAMQEVKNSFFGGSIKKMLCFFVEEEKLTAEEIQKLLEEIEE